MWKSYFRSVNKNYGYVLLSYLLAFTAMAADFNNCAVTEIVVVGTNNAHVSLDCGISPRPACATAGSFFGFDKATEAGKQYLSVVLTAFATGSKLTGDVDDNVCSPHQGNVAQLIHLRMRK